jgi:hypothetical protein
VEKAGHLFYIARHPDKIDSAKSTVTDPQEFVSVSDKQF